MLMSREEAIVLVEKELNKGERTAFKVKSYSSGFYLSLFRKFNYWKYVKRVPILRLIDFERFFKPDIEKEDPLVINERYITETSRFWIIYWNTNSFVNDFDLNNGLIGPGPYLVEKNSRKLYAAGSGMVEFVKQIKEEQLIDEEFLKKLEIKIMQDGD